MSESTAFKKGDVVRHANGRRYLIRSVDAAMGKALAEPLIPGAGKYSIAGKWAIGGVGVWIKIEKCEIAQKEES